MLDLGALDTEIDMNFPVTSDGITPLMLAFTSIDTLIIRSTGLVVAMFSGLVATGPFMRKGLADIKLVFLGALPILFQAFVRKTLRVLYVLNSLEQF